VPARHLYVHLPFCSSRCGYCDFVTVVGRRSEHGGYVDALLRELELERALLDNELESVYLGGGTPTLTEPGLLARLLDELPRAAEVTVEANPETVTPDLASLLAGRVTRVSLGAQTFSPALLATLGRVARPDDVRAAFYALRDAGIGNISLDLIYGIPGQEPADLARDLAEAVALEPEHVSAYELEAKPGTRFTHAHGAELERQAESMETYFERAVETLTSAGFRWYETANFCRSPGLVGGRDLRARHNLGYWLGRDYLGLGVGAVSTIESLRWRNAPSLARYVTSLVHGKRPPREVEEVPSDVRMTERVMLGLRLDEPLPLAGLEHTLDPVEVERFAQLGLVQLGPVQVGPVEVGPVQLGPVQLGAVESGFVEPGRPRRDHGTLTLTRRGRFVGGGLTARLLA
jgi:putative oxygen-independent coproporphyrinogen III oxidase